MSSVQDKVNVKCIYHDDARVIQISKNIEFNEFIQNVSQEFGFPVKVEQFIDAEGTLIKLGDNSSLDIASQLNFPNQDRISLYNLTVFLSQDLPIHDKKIIINHKNERNRLIKSHSRDTLLKKSIHRKIYPYNIDAKNFEMERRNSNPDFRRESRNIFDELELARRQSLSTPKLHNREEEGDIIISKEDSFDLEKEGDDIKLHSSKKRFKDKVNLRVSIPHNNFYDGPYYSQSARSSYSGFESPPGGSFNPFYSKLNGYYSNNSSPKYDLPTFHQNPFPDGSDMNLSPNTVRFSVDGEFFNDSPRSFKIDSERKQPKNLIDLKERRPESFKIKRKAEKSKQVHRKSSRRKNFEKIKRYSLPVLPDKNIVNNTSSFNPDSSFFGKKLPFTWKKGELIGRGAFGNVYKGLLSTGQFVAVKHLEIPGNIENEKNAHFISFIKEIELLKNLNHPNIVRYIGSTSENNNIYVFLEYVSGGSIASIINKYGHLEESMIRNYAKQILYAINYLHENNIVHRDIKGANILIDTDGLAKLADFGCSKIIELKSSTSGIDSLLGTPFWMAPEVMSQTQHGIKVDIWSFGCTLIEMASGKPPWSQEYSQITALILDIVKSDKIPTIPEHISDEFKDLIKKCLNRNPDERPTAKELLQHPWFTSKKRSKKRSFSNYSLQKMDMDILVHVLKHLDYKSIKNLSLTNLHFHRMLYKDVLWKKIVRIKHPHTFEHLSNKDLKEKKLYQRAYVKIENCNIYWSNSSQLKNTIILKGHSKSLNKIKLLEDRKFLVSCSGDKKIKIWDIENTDTNSPIKISKPYQVLRGHSSSIKSFIVVNNKTLISGSHDKTLKIWDIVSNNQLITLKSHESPINIVHSSNNQVFISGSLDGCIKVWDQNKSTLINTISSHSVEIIDAKIVNSNIYKLSIDNSISIWDTRSLKLTHTFQGNDLTCMDIFGYSIYTGSSDGTFKIWDIRNNSSVNIFESNEKKKFHKINSISLNSFSMVNILKQDGSIIFYDINTKDVILKKVEPKSQIFDIHNSNIATSGADRTIKIWSCE